MEKPFQPLPPVPDHPELEREILDWWEAERIFPRLREQLAGRPKWSFIDGPKTANTTDGLGVHHLWGRTYKDVFQRYKALRGFDQRFQNGFDCQGLWVEVKVERDLGLNSKREIEEYGLDGFARKCRELVAASARVITEQSIRLGQWMDWGNDYYTFSDTNIEYIWRFLKTVHERGWLYLGHRSTEWCPRCGTSISQHELSQSDVYQEKSDPSLFVRFPLKGRENESLVIWTTTPWTLPANVAAAVNPEAEYGKRDNGEWVAVARYPEDTFVERVKGSELVGLEYEGPYDHIGPGSGVRHRVIPWEDVSLEDGTGIVHIAPGAGTEDFELSRVHDLPVLVPVDEAGHFYPDYGWLHGLSTVEAADQIVGDLRERGLLENAETYVHRYPHCWRCATPVIFRVVDDWFIGVEELRQPLLDANATIEWTPDFYGKRMEDWLRNMGDWNISRKRYFGLPLPFYPCECGHLNVVGSRAELEERAVSGLDQLEELHRPWIDEVPIRCAECDAEVRRVPEVGDVWLDAGIVPFSTLGWQNPAYIPGGYATGASKGLSGADLPDHAYWEQWFPADWVTEMREQIRLWFYSQLFMSVAIDGRAPFKRVLGHEDVRDEHGHEMHNSKGNAIEAHEALERMGADVMRWMYCEQAPTQGVRFGYTPAGDIKRRLLTLWNSASFLVTYANIEGWRPRWEDLAGGPAGELRPLDRWLVARTQKFVADTEDAYERYWTRDVVRGFDAFVDDVSNWYIRRSRRRFYSLDEPAAFATLWYALVQAVRAIAPVMPFLAEHLWRNLTASAEGAPESVHLAGWPDRREWDAAVVTEVAEVRRVVELGRQARAGRGIRHRQPLQRLIIRGAQAGARAHQDEIKDELRVREIDFTASDIRALAGYRLKLNYPKVGRRLGPKIPELEAALAGGDWDQLDDGSWEVAGVRLAADEVDFRPGGPAGNQWAYVNDGDLAVALDTELNAELEREGEVFDLIHRLNSMRKDAGLDLTDRIRVTLPRAMEPLLEHADWIARETLATSVEAGDAGEPQIERI